MEEVDRLAAACGPDSLRSFIHTFAHSLPEEHRPLFLSQLASCCPQNGQAPAAPPQAEKGLADKVEKVLEMLEVLEEGDRMLTCRPNEEWDDWYDDVDEEFLFDDPDHILADLDLAFRLVHTCLDQADYKSGAALADALSLLDIPVSGEYVEDSMTIQDLVLSYGLLDVDYRAFIREALYLVCLGSDEQDRAEAMVSVMGRLGPCSVTLEEILQTGPDEIDLQVFLGEWIDALAKRTEAYADPLLTEAIDLMPDKDIALYCASRYAGSHPVLYLHLLETCETQTGPEEVLSLGFRALKEVPVKSPVRSRIALLTARKALAAADRRRAEDCWLEAFRSSPTPVSYLRLRLLSGNWSSYAGQVREIYLARYASLREEDRNSHASILFFDEQFDKMQALFMKPGKGIGWTYTFMKQGLALMLLALNRGSADRPGLEAMLDLAMRGCGFGRDSYLDGTDEPAPDSSSLLFRDCFDRWKASVRLSEDTAADWTDQAKEWISLRVSAIMQANRRNHYRECAGFIAALGEVLESFGETSALNRLLLSYKAAYPRRRAFHTELRSFGMND